MLGLSRQSAPRNKWWPARSMRPAGSLDHPTGERSPTNVRRFYDLIKQSQPEQHAFYDAHSVAFAEGFSLKSLKASLQPALKFLQANSERGDAVCLLEFGWGAYVARVIATILTQPGLSPAHSEDALSDFIHELAISDPRLPDSLFREVHFLGLWDTIAPREGANRLPRPRIDARVVHASHALALDESQAPPAMLLAERRDEPFSEITLEPSARCGSQGTITTLVAAIPLKSTNSGSFPSRG
jgi:hypothetical protein